MHGGGGGVVDRDVDALLGERLRGRHSEHRDAPGVVRMRDVHCATARSARLCQWVTACG